MRKITKFLLLGTAIMTTSVYTYGQEKFRFNGVGRAVMTNNVYGGTEAETDTITRDRENGGHTMVDLNMTVTPNKNTEIKAVMRFRNEFDGFWGGGASVELRQLTAKGVVADKFRYQVGDIYLKKSPYTIYNYDEEGKTMNEAAVFSLLNNYKHYDNFYDGNHWRQQGLDGTLKIGVSDKIESIDVNGFIAQNRGSNFFGELNRLYGGASVDVNVNEGFGIQLNYVNLFDVQTVNEGGEPSYSNPVMTAGAQYKLELEAMDLEISSELGNSKVTYSNQADLPEGADKSDYFIDGQINGKLKSQNVGFGLKYRNVGYGFRSAGAQTRRVDYAAAPTTMSVVGNNPDWRAVSLLDINQDPAVYNQSLTAELMTFQYLFSPVLAYGDATPNRTGVSISADYADKSKIVELEAVAHVLTEIRPVGTTDKRGFFVLGSGVDVNIDKVLEWEKTLKLTGGIEMNSVNRDGDFAGIDYSTMLVDAGLEIEIYDKLSLLGGMKMLTANGNEYLEDVDNYEVVEGLPEQFYDASQTINAFGLKYQFSENSFVTAQGQLFDYSWSDELGNSSDYSINQFLFLFNMKF